MAQLLFLASSNLVGFFLDSRTEMGPEGRAVMETLGPGWPEQKGHLWHLMDHVVKTDKMWAQATGQLQIWSLFAPTIGRECVFPALELRWDEEPASAPALARSLATLAAHHSWEVLSFTRAGTSPSKAIEPELVLSLNEPLRPDHYVRWGEFRLRRYENNLVLTLVPHEEEAESKRNARWRDKIRAHVADYGDILPGYLRWRLGRAMKRWPDRGLPRQVILVMRRFHITDVEEAPPFWQGPHSVPLVRWQPGVHWTAGSGPLEPFDPVTGRFTSAHP